jgi:hypothetical protein
MQKQKAYNKCKIRLIWWLIVPKQWIPIDAIKQKDVGSQLQYFDEQEKDETFKEMLDLMEREKLSIQSFARSNIEQQMYKNAKFYLLTYGTIEKKFVKNLSDLKQVYKETTHKKTVKKCGT